MISRPSFMEQWPSAYPRRRGQWTLAAPGQAWGLLNPERGTHHVTNPRDDTALPAMSAALEQGDLLGYRVGRRAIVATPAGFIKVVRPKRLKSLVEIHTSLGRSGLPVVFPKVINRDTSGWLELNRVPGLSLHELLRAAEPTATLNALDDIGIALAVFHSTPPPPTLAARRIDTPNRWIETVGRVEPETAPELNQIAATLPPVPPVSGAMVHGDLHDKNVFASANTVALIDLDGVGLGAAEDDVANLGVHLQLRALQAGRVESDGDHVRRFYDAYQSMRTLDRVRLRAVERHTWFRLACIYRFRVAGRPLVAELLRRAGSNQR